MVFSGDEQVDRPYLLSRVFQLAMFIPLLAAGWRRLHDTGRPGWYLLVPSAISILAFVGAFGGVAGFTLMEGHVADRETLRAPAAFLGMAGLGLAALVQLVVSILLIWWLTRPSQAHTNRYGPAEAV